MAWPHWTELIERLRHWQDRGWIEPPGGGLLVCHRPTEAPLAYLHRIYPPLDKAAVEIANEAYGGSFPPTFRAFLSSANGCRLFDCLSLSGSTLNAGRVDLVDRDPTNALGQPMSLRYGNVVERPSGLPHAAMSIGGMTGGTGRGKLVMAQSGEVALVHPVDGSDVAARWPTLEAMLFSEIDRLALLFDANENMRLGSDELLPEAARRWETPQQAKRQGWLARLRRH